MTNSKGYNTTPTRALVERKPPTQVALLPAEIHRWQLESRGVLKAAREMGPFFQLMGSRAFMYPYSDFATDFG